MKVFLTVCITLEIVIRLFLVTVHGNSAKANTLFSAGCSLRVQRKAFILRICLHCNKRPGGKAVAGLGQLTCAAGLQNCSIDVWPRAGVLVLRPCKGGWVLEPRCQPEPKHLRCQFEPCSPSLSQPTRPLGLGATGFLLQCRHTPNVLPSLTFHMTLGKADIRALHLG